MKADLTTWQTFLGNFNGRSFFLADEWITSATLNLYTDASGSLGYGAIFGDRWYYGEWPVKWKGLNITFTGILSYCDQCYDLGATDAKPTYNVFHR